MRKVKKITSVVLSFLLAISALVCAVPGLLPDAKADSTFTSDLKALPDGTSTYNGHAYKLITTGTDWATAKTACEDLGGHLVTITSSGENDFVSNLMGTNAAWIGFYCVKNTASADTGNYRWVNGESWSYSNWASNEPGNTTSTSEPCGAMVNGQWYDITASYNQGYYVCEWEYTCNHTYNVTTSGTLTIATCTKCGKAFWIDTTNKCAGYNGHFYELRKQNALKWSAAKNACEKSGGHLASISDAVENDTVSTLAYLCSVSASWIGYSRSTDDTIAYGPYSWSDGSDTTFTNWNSGEPNGVAEYYACLSAGSYLDKWNDAGNITADSYICEYDWDITPFYYANCVKTAETCTTDGNWKFKNLSDNTLDLEITPDTTVYNGHKYAYCSGSYLYSQAQFICESMGGHLATISSAAENSAVAAAADGYTAFIGLADFDHTGVYGSTSASQASAMYWVDGTSVSYTNFKSGEPNNSNPSNDNYEGYVEMVSDGVWNDIYYDTTAGFVCEWDNADLPVKGGHKYVINSIVTPTYDHGGTINYYCTVCGDTYSSTYADKLTKDSTSFMSGQVLPEGVSTYGGHSYMVLGAQMTRNEANSACIVAGGHLATITSSGENDFISGLLGDKAAWIGIYDPDSAASNNKFCWITGEGFTYTNWASGEPNSTSGSEPYGAMLNGVWYDLAETGKGYYVCEWDYTCAHTYKITTSGTRAIYTCTKCGATFWVDLTNKCASYNGHFYEARTHQPLKGTVAYNACLRSGGDLISIGDSAENDMAALLANGLGMTSWLGCYRDPSAASCYSTYKWTDNSGVTFTNWDGGEPNGSDECIACLYAGDYTQKWNDASLTETMNYICEYSWDPADYYFDTRTVTAPTCLTDGSWVYKNAAGTVAATLTPTTSVYGGHKYAYINKSLTYAQAELACKSMGGHLAVISDSDENDFVKSVAGGNTAYIGLSDFDHLGDNTKTNTEQSDVMYWVDDSAVSYTNWDSGEPNNGGASKYEGCTCILSDGTWNDVAADTTNCFVCEWDNATLPAAALGHNFGPYVTTTAPTSTSVGVQTSTCANDSTHTLTRPCYYVNFPSGSHYTISDISSNYSELLASDTCTFKLAVDAGYGKNLIVSGSNCTVTGSDGSYSVTSFTGVPTVSVSFEPNNYSVSYDANGGTGAPAAFTATFDQTYYAGAAPTKTGYTFTGWLGSNGTTYQAGDELKNLVLSDGGTFSLTAQWEINHYDVRFFNYDGTQIGETQSIEYGKDATAPAAPAKPYDNNAHYTFNGWTGYTNITKNTDITAAFTAVQHSYTYAVTTAPTKTTAGLLTGTCTCGKTVTVNIPALNDTDYAVTTTAATPDAAGNTHYVWNDNDTYGVNVTADIAIPALGYTVSFYQEDGTTLIQAQHADTLAAAVAAYDGALPAKDATAQYTYHFDKWVTSAVDEAAGTYRAVPTFTSTVNKYDVRFFNYDGVQIGETQSIEYGSDATAPAAPVKASDETNHYTFDGWTGYTNITKNTDITAAFTAAAHSYTYAVTTEPTKTAAGLLTGTCTCGREVTVTLPALNDTDYDLVTVAATTDAAGSETYTWKNNDTYGVNVTVTIVIPKISFTVSFYDESGVTLLDTQTAGSLDDAVAAYSGAAQTKAETAQYTYTFAGWTTTATDVNNGLYKAVAKFDETTRKYTVTFKNDDGAVLDTQSVAYGSGATAPTKPTKAATAQYSYTFAGWDKTFDNITGDLTVTATYSQTVNTYTVTYYNNDGTVLYTVQVPYGSSVTYAGAAPAYVGENAKDMEFVGWSVTTDSITGETTVKAVYKDTGTVLSRFFDKLVSLIVKIRELLLHITKAHGDTYDVNIWTGGKWQ